MAFSRLASHQEGTRKWLSLSMLINNINAGLRVRSHPGDCFILQQLHFSSNSENCCSAHVQETSASLNFVLSSSALCSTVLKSCRTGSGAINGHNFLGWKRNMLARYYKAIRTKLKSNNIVILQSLYRSSSGQCGE